MFSPLVLLGSFVVFESSSAASSPSPPPPRLYFAALASNVCASEAVVVCIRSGCDRLARLCCDAAKKTNKINLHLLHLKY